MSKVRSFLNLTLLGGIGVLLPAVVFALCLNWLFVFTTDMIQPMTNLVVNWFQLPEVAGDAIVVAFMLFVCFLVGLLLKTGVGRWIHHRFDHVLVRLAPGYKTIKEIVSQLLGLGDDSDSLMNGEVARAWLFGRDTPTTVTAIITSRHQNGLVTVYVPTAPVPTSGLTYHLPEDCVEPLPGISVEEAMRTVIACGSGSAAMFEKHG
jgi:uncharacterized membrane protein